MIEPMTKQRFSMEVERAVAYGKVDYMDAILELAEKFMIDPADAAALCSPILKKKLEVECIKNKLIEGDYNPLME